MTIKENDFRKIDLNLLIAFAVLYREQSVSAAADKLHLGQPAVSGVLSRLRTLFDDPLFIRSGHKMQPTAAPANCTVNFCRCWSSCRVRCFNKRRSMRKPQRRR